MLISVLSELSNNNHLLPVISIASYLAYPKNLRINHSLLYSLSIFHNSALILFSAWTFVSISQIICKNGLVFQSNYYFRSKDFDLVIYWFYISKYYEFFDTFLLYLKGRNPIFLQKYHHIGAVICWHLSYVYKVDSIWIPTIANSFVHTIMYSYYLGSLLKISRIRFVKKYITLLQLTQLCTPCFICIYYYAPPVESTFNYNIILVFLFYVIGLVALFSQFYYTNYIKPKHEYLH
jgi:hypothetical protein